MENLRAIVNGYTAALQVEQGLSSNSIKAYVQDVHRFLQFLLQVVAHDDMGDGVELSENYEGWPASLHLHSVNYSVLQDYINQFGALALAPATQARAVSALKSFFNYLLTEHIIEALPTERLQVPKLSKKLPVVLSPEEIDLLIQQIDHSSFAGLRSRAIIEVLYACGLRVSELTDLRLSHVYKDLQLLKVTGKGNKERLVPIHDLALRHLYIYIEQARKGLAIAPKAEDIVFVNQRGFGLSRVSVFNLVKQLAAKAGILKNVSPHSLRHCYATHLYEGGADLRVIQQLLGHQSITTTEIYAHISQSYLKDTMQQFHPRF